MAATTLIEALAALWWLAALAIFVLSLFGALLQPRIRRAPAPGKSPCSLLLPIKLMNPGFERAQASAFAQDHPDYEVIVGAMEAQSPALALMRALAGPARCPVRFVHSRVTGAVSPKLENLATPIEDAKHDVIVTKDSNITFDSDTLGMLTGALGPEVGLVCAVPVAVRAETLAGRIEAILINRDARLLLTAAALGKGYGVGKATAFRRGDLARAGGVTAIGYTVAEDTALCRAMAGIGLRTIFASTTVAQEIGACRFADVYGRQARWAVIRRAEEPFTYAFEPIACPFPASVAGAIAAVPLGLAPSVVFFATLIAWYLAEVAVTGLKGWEVRPWTPFAFLGREVVLLAAWVRALTTREIIWAGRRQDVRDMMHDPKRR